MGCAHGLCLVVSGPRAEERCQGDNKCNDHHLEGENGPESKEVKLMCGVWALAGPILSKKPPKVIQNSIFQSWGSHPCFQWATLGLAANYSSCALLWHKDVPGASACDNFFKFFFSYLRYSRKTSNKYLPHLKKTTSNHQTSFQNTRDSSEAVTERGSGCSQLQKARVVGESDNVRLGVEAVV